jgi:hypothetical protein
MSAWSGYLSSLISATALAVTVVLLSRRSLRQLLVELCGNSARAEYWTMFAGMFLVLCTLYGVLAAMPSPDSSAGAAHAELLAALNAFRSGVLGLLIASMLVSFVLLRSIGRVEDLASRRKPAWAEKIPPLVTSNSGVHPPA